MNTLFADEPLVLSDPYRVSSVCSRATLKTDSLKVLLAKMEEYRQNGAQLGWLLSCDDEKAYIFRVGQADYETVEGFDHKLSGEDVLPGFRLDLRRLR